MRTTDFSLRLPVNWIFGILLTPTLTLKPALPELGTAQQPPVKGPEGWTLYPFPGPKLVNDSGTGSAEASYYAWVDQHDTLGLGKNTPIATGNANDALLALGDNKFVTLRVPYPLGFYVKGMDGRIDDPNGGWRGKGVWTAWGTRAPFHAECGKDNRPKVVHFQLRPDPLAD